MYGSYDMGERCTYVEISSRFFSHEYGLEIFQFTAITKYSSTLEVVFRATYSIGPNHHLDHMKLLMRVFA